MRFKLADVTGFVIKVFKHERDLIKFDVTIYHHVYPNFPTKSKTLPSKTIPSLTNS